MTRIIGWLALGAMLSFGTAARAAQADDHAAAPASRVAPAASDARYAHVRLYERWAPTVQGGASAAQCNGGAHGEIVTGFGDWSRTIRMATNGAPGGCIMQLAVIDPEHSLQDWQPITRFTPTGDPGQCGNAGINRVPVVRTLEQARAQASSIVVDTDNRPGGCELQFATNVPGPRIGVWFDTERSRGPWDNGCQMTGQQAAAVNQPATIHIDTDDARSACLFQMGLFPDRDPLKPHAKVSYR
ncbi:MAG: hypothetical protein V4801_31080 [Burkholderia gladioli]